MTKARAGAGAGAEGVLHVDTDSRKLSLKTGILLARRTTASRPDTIGVVSAVVAWIALVAQAAAPATDEAWEYAWTLINVGVPLLAIGTVITLLSTWWSVDVYATLAFRRVTDLQHATHVKAVPRPHCGAAAVCEILRSGDARGVQMLGTELSLPAVWFVFQKTLYSLRVTQDGPLATVLDFPDRLPISAYAAWTGHTTTTLDAATKKWGSNTFEIPVPPFGELFKEHAVSPFFVFQVFCVCLWCLDDNFMFPMFTLFMLVSFEALVVRQRQDNLRTLRSMRRPAQTLLAFRQGGWVKVNSADLVPGDLVSVTKSPTTEETVAFRPMLPSGRPAQHTVNRTRSVECTVPCDILLLRGAAVVNEAMLTGESVPQQRDGLDWTDLAAPLAAVDGTSLLHSRSLVHGGTRVLNALPGPAASGRNVSNLASVPSPPDKGGIGIVLRTGFYTSQGDLMRTIMFSTEHVSAVDRTAFKFIACLLVFAIAASSFVLYHGLMDESRSRFKLLLHCIMILTYVVPPELPMELSFAVTTSLQALAKTGVFCTEPYRIPFAGRVDVCCFDKTGTLTSDRLFVRQLAGLPDTHGRQTPVVALTKAAVRDAPVTTAHVIAACHSLSFVDGRLAGDPAEMSALEALNWSVSDEHIRPGAKGPSFVTDGRKGTDKLVVVRRFPFQSALRRMAVVIAEQHLPGAPLSVLMKGAPEAIRRLLTQVPQDYDRVARTLTLEGLRVIAMAHRRLPADVTADAVLRMSRDQLERDMQFAGFMLVECPLKPDTHSVLTHLASSSHRLVMITGDHPLTAISTAKQVGIMSTDRSRRVLLLTTQADDPNIIDGSVDILQWEDISPSASMDECRSAFNPTSLDFFNADVAVTGQAFHTLMAGAHTHAGTATALAHLVKHTSVFARVSPTQKEDIVTWINRAGHHTLMCGDGTNDVGALTQAHVGISILNNINLEDKLQAVREVRAQATAAAVEGPAVTAARPGAPAPASLQQRLAELTQQLQEESSIVQFGDASVASPFTSKRPTISCTEDLIRQGRCTLVATVQMYKILAVNCLILSYMLSAMYLHGVKESDTQATATGLLVAGFYFFISRATPVPTLSKERPPNSVFEFRLIASIVGQFVVHLTSLILVVELCKPFHTGTVDVDGPFTPNVLNSCVWLLGVSMQSSAFVANYWGRPFMQSLLEMKNFLKCVVGTYAVIWLTALDIMPALGEFWEIVPLPTFEARLMLFGLMFADSFLAIGWEYLTRTFCNRRRVVS